MPVLKHAKKKLRQDKRRTVDNLRIKSFYKKLIKEAKKQPTTESLRKAFQAIDKAAKKYVIHKNKAARLKSSLSKVAAKQTTIPEEKKGEGKKAVAKTKKVKSKSTKKSSRNK